MLPTSPQQDQAPSTWKHEAIRRGTLRITGPPPADLPPVEPVDDADNDDRDDKDDKLLSPKRFTDSHTLDLRSTHSSTRRRLLRKASLDIGHRVGVSAVFPTHKRTSTEIQETIMQSSISVSGASTATPTTIGRPSKRQKRGSLSAAFKRIFGSKRRLERDSERSRTASPPRHAYHHSEPQARRVSPPRTFTTEPRVETSSSDELPSFTDNLGRGTPIQLPFPMNVNAPQEESSDLDYIAFDQARPIHRRRATLPSMVFNSTDASTLSAIWSESASRHEDQRSIKDEIGIAVSGPEHRQSFSSQGPRRRSNRRSRSAGALEDLRRLHERDPSNRNSIVNSLRQIRTPGSRPQTSHVPTTEEEEDVIMHDQDEVFETPAEGVSRASSSDTVMRASPPASPSPGGHEVHAFDFGPWRTGHGSPALNTPSALGQQFETSAEPPLVPLDERMERLESNMRYFDESLRRLHGRQNRQTIILEKAPLGRGHARNLSTSSEDSPRYPKRPSIPFADSQQQVPSPVSLTSSPHDSQFTQPQASSSVLSGQMFYSPAQYSQSLPQHRLPSPKTSLPNLMSSPSMTTMSSAPTMVATAGLPPPSSHSYTEQHSYAPDQMTALYSLLYHERAARKDLESQVDDLRREMGDLRLRVERQYPRSHPDGYNNNSTQQNTGGDSYANNYCSTLGKTHVTSNIYNYAAYPGTQNAYPTPSPDVSILLGTTTTSSTEQLAAIHPRISQLNYEEEASKQRTSRFSFESDELDLPDNGRASKRHSGAGNNSPGSQRQSFLRYGGPVVADRSSSVYEYGYPPDDETEITSDDAKAGMEEYQTPLEEPESPAPRDGEEVFTGVGVAVGGPLPVRKISLGKMI
ncbi:uncharacterized protein BKCO1_2400015 [Diplodia corticola]|uniref:Uncharacterized protein n=1 Tax=Diplodia corticola TaxID=236234 RepID=A0A1J9R1U9_9PEZI|nr:uncharacterized protein BKCO1_2400015 [Diplodia corticola]OJD34226.1 hypothetical protein BKCO1_2400015 [Diplodia corticola]